MLALWRLGARKLSKGAGKGRGGSRHFGTSTSWPAFALCWTARPQQVVRPAAPHPCPHVRRSPLPAPSASPCCSSCSRRAQRPRRHSTRRRPAARACALRRSPGASTGTAWPRSCRGRQGRRRGRRGRRRRRSWAARGSGSRVGALRSEGRAVVRVVRLLPRGQKRWKVPIPGLASHDLLARSARSLGIYSILSEGWALIWRYSSAATLIPTRVLRYLVSEVPASGSQVRGAGSQPFAHPGRLGFVLASIELDG